MLKKTILGLSCDEKHKYKHHFPFSYEQTFSCKSKLVNSRLLLQFVMCPLEIAVYDDKLVQTKKKIQTDLFTFSNKNIALVWSRLCSSLLFFKLRFHRATNQCNKNQNQKKTTNIRFRFRTNKRFQVSKHRSHWVSHLCSYCIYYCSFSTFSSLNSLITHILVCDID